MIRNIVCLVAMFSLIILGGCRKDSQEELRGEPLSEVFLRYTPQVGHTYNYACSVNLDKKTFGKLRNENAHATISYKIISMQTDKYHIKTKTQFNKSNLKKEVLANVKEKIKSMESSELIVSDRYVFNQSGTNNLCFPDGPIRPGATWQGECMFTFGDLATVDAPMMKMSYQLAQAVENKDGKYCIIECEPLVKEVNIPFQLGQLGLKCDTKGRVIAVRKDSDAQDKIMVGDILIGINKEEATTSRNRSILYERFIEPPENIGAVVQLTILRNDKEHNVDIKKSSVTLGAIKVSIKRDSRSVLFAIDKGIIISDQSAALYSVVYDFADEQPFVDDYTGTEPLKNIAKRKMPPRIYDSKWKLKLIP